MEATLADGKAQLRLLRDDDAEALWPYVSNPELSKFMSWDPHANIDQTRAFITDVRRRMDEGSNVTWVVELEGKASGLVSLIGILRTHRSLRYDKGELAYWLGPEFRGRGIATEAVAAAMCFGFEELGLNKITVAHVRENDASKNLILRLGFRHVGIEHSHFAKHGRWFDHVTYELLKSDWVKGPTGKRS